MATVGMFDYRAMGAEFHGIDDLTDVAMLKQLVAKYSAYQQQLARWVGEQTAIGVVDDAVADHMHVTTELISRALGQLYHLGALEEISAHFPGYNDAS